MTDAAPEVCVYNETKQTSLAARVRVADSGLSRMIGLLGRRSLLPDTGIWIVPANAIHTIGMLFRFDVILIDKSYRVVGLHERIRPFSMTWPRFRARSVLELYAGAISESHTEVSDQLRIDPATAP
jgi:uncharacterized membrane protein (UPF0127 family)